MTERIYVVLHATKKVAYIGRTNQTIEERFEQHKRDAANVLYEKKLSEALRHEPDAFHIELCEEADGETELSEADWMEQFRQDGYTLLNTAGGAKRAPRREAKEDGWKARPIYVLSSQKGVGLKAITQEQYEEFAALPTADQRWAWVKALKTPKAA